MDSKTPTQKDKPGASGSTSDPQPGDALERERYTVGALLARGGMGEVHSAFDEQIGRTVAIKRLRAESDHGVAAVARFLREARVQGRLEHPAIVPVHELSRDEDGHPFFVMKQLTGVTLAHVLEGGDSIKFSRQRLLRAFVDICLAIEFAHTRGVLHRDLKPANIMLGDFGETYVLDWGVARVMRDDPALGSTPAPEDNFATVAGSVLGTPGYIAPEYFLDGCEIDERADIYALGCVLFEILAGQRLLDVGVRDMALAVVPRDARPSVRAPGRDVPPELDAICVRATAVDRDVRFATARELADAVQRYLDGDRDLALRKSLATDETSAANAALARGDATGRQDAIRHAARAMVLDPAAAEPPVLVARMMLEPPTETPREVEDVLAERELDDMRKDASYGVLAGIVYILFLPIVYWVGIRPLWFFIIVPVLSSLTIYAETVVVHRNPVHSGRISLISQLGLLAAIAFATSPLLIGAAPGCVLIMLMGTEPAVARTWIIALLAAVATLGPFVLAQIGWLSTLFTTEGQRVILRLGGADATIDHTAAFVALVAYTIGLLAMATAISMGQQGDRARSRRALELQSWQLRQLLPK